MLRGAGFLPSAKTEGLGKPGDSWDYPISNSGRDLRLKHHLIKTPSPKPTLSVVSSSVRESWGGSKENLMFSEVVYCQRMIRLFSEKSLHTLRRAIKCLATESTLMELSG